MMMMAASLSFSVKDLDDPKLVEQKLWLDAEMEKILEQRNQVELLEKVTFNTGLFL